MRKENSGRNKVCILTSAHPALNTRPFYKEAVTLVKAGYDVTMIAQHHKNEVVDGVKIIALPTPKNRFYRTFGTTLKVFGLALKQKAHVYHFHDPELVPICFLLKLFTKAKVIYDVHEDFPQDILSKDWIPKMVRKPMSILFNWFEKSASRKIDYIFAATPFIKNNFKHCRVINIGNYPIIADFNSQILQKQNGIFKKKEYIVIYMGHLTRARGIKEIVEALRFISPKYKARLKLLGDFSDRVLEDEVKNLKEWEMVEYLGWVPQEEIPRHLEKVDIGLVCFLPGPNHMNSLPTKIFEYMLAELSVVASNFPLWKEIIEGNDCGICVNPLEPKEIAKAIEHLVEHPEEAKKMGTNGRRAVLEEYRWENEAKKMLKIYEELLDKMS